MAGALIVTAELGRDDFAWLNSLRAQHYPADSNRVPAHLTMFHALPPSGEPEVRRRLASLSARRRPQARVVGLMDLGGGVAFRVVSDDLELLRGELSAAFHGLLGAQDAGGWRPHVTIQNKVAPKAARELLSSLERSFTPRPLAISGLGLHRYRDGPWETLAIHSFRGG